MPIKLVLIRTHFTRHPLASHFVSNGDAQAGVDGGSPRDLLGRPAEVGVSVVALNFISGGKLNPFQKPEYCPVNKR